MQNKKNKKENKMKTKQGRIRLTEQELHYLVEDAVRTYLINEGMDEDLKGNFRGGMNWIYNKFRGNNQQAPETADQQVTQPVETEPQKKGNFLQRWGNSMANAGEQLEDFKSAVKKGGYNGDAQKYINNAATALKSLLDADKNMVAAGGVGIGNGQARKAVQTALNYLDKSQGGYNMRNRFNKNV
jgi:hypothetical protein